MAYIFQRPFLRGSSTEGYLRLQIYWASLIVQSKFTILSLFNFVFEGNFPSTSPGGGLYLEGRFNLTEGFLPHWFGGLIHGGAYFRNFIVTLFQPFQYNLRCNSLDDKNKVY